MRKITTSEWERMAVMVRYDAKALAKLCQRSVRQLQRDFRIAFGRPPQEWLNEQRLKAAEQRLVAGEPVKKVALDLGFKQSSHFCRQFKISHQITPSQFAAIRPPA